jgi:small GTP-binding protein
MPINAGPEYFAAEKKYLAAQTTEERIIRLEELIRVAPKHKSSENLLKELRTRLKKLKQQAEKSKKVGAGKKGIRKEHFQCVIVGPPNSGKSSLLAKLTNAKPKIEPYPFTTKEPEIGTLDYDGVKAQIIDTPPIGSENFNHGLINTADLLLVTLEKLSDLKEISSTIKKSPSKKLIIINKSDLLSDTELRKLSETLKSKKLPGLLVSCTTLHGIPELKQKIFNEMPIIRVYTKEPGKQPTKDPIVLPKNSTLKDAAEKIRKGFSSQIKEARVTGPSSKFPNQKVGLSHVLKDLDIVEFHTK